MLHASANPKKRENKSVIPYKESHSFLGCQGKLYLLWKLPLLNQELLYNACTSLCYVLHVFDVIDTHTTQDLYSVGVQERGSKEMEGEKHCDTRWRNTA